MNLTHQQTILGVPVNQHTMLDRWCVHRKTLFRYILVSI
jgi:hypothetical protein